MSRLVKMGCISWGFRVGSIGDLSKEHPLVDRLLSILLLWI
ncbi:unnamed protein product [Acidithrix sp. C25]|nr:unnamed protein product [Acidithrix sp. C25]